MTIEYVIFDMDGLLINSEKVYTDVTNLILARYGKVMTWDIKAQLMGKTEKAAGETLMSHFPDIDLTAEQYIAERNVKQDEEWPKVELMAGAAKLVKHLHDSGTPIALATGSSSHELVLKTGHLQDIFGLFGGNVVCGDDMGLKKGKPAPDVFLLAAGLLGRSVGEGEGDQVSEEHRLERSKGLVFEDAIPGVNGGKRAGMNVVWVPDPRLRSLKTSSDYDADETFDSLEQFEPTKWGLPPYKD